MVCSDIIFASDYTAQWHVSNVEFVTNIHNLIFLGMGMLLFCIQEYIHLDVIGLNGNF